LLRRNEMRSDDFWPIMIVIGLGSLAVGGILGLVAAIVWVAKMVWEG